MEAMATYGGSRTRAAAWLVVALLLGECAIAVRLATDEADSLTNLGEDPLQQLSKAYTAGKTFEAETNCENITIHMVGETAQVQTQLNMVCIENTCDFTKLGVDEILFAQGVVSSLVSAADDKKCLPQVLGNEQVQEQLLELLSIVPQLLDAAPTQDGRDRVTETYLQLVTWQKGVQALEDGLVNRQLLLDVDALKGSGCPKPCGRCDNKGSSSFGFRCLLLGRDKDEVPAVDGGVTCSEPKGRGLWRKYKFSIQCEVNDWKEDALQHLHVSAMLSCASITMLMGVNGGISQSRRQEMYRVCLKTEQGNALSDTEEKDYQDQLSVDDGIVPQGVKLALTTILVYGIGYGLGGLRSASRDNGRLPVLIEGGMRELEPEDFFAPFASFLTSQVRTLDLQTYGDPALIQRDETLHKLNTCDYMFNLRSQDTFAEAMAPFAIMGLTMRGDGLSALMETDETTTTTTVYWTAARITQWIFGTSIGTFLAWILTTILNVVFFTPNLVLGWIPIVGTSIGALQLALNIAGWYYIYSNVFTYLGSILGVKNAEEKLQTCMEDAVVLGHT